MKRIYILLLLVYILPPASAVDEPVDISEIDMGIVDAHCTGVKSANVIYIEGLGEVALIGVLEASPGEPYYDEAVKLLKKRLLGKKVRVEVCPNMPVNGKGQVRAIIYYSDGGKWLNVGIELIEKGLARVAIVPSCHVDTKAYLEYEKVARNARLGLWKDWEGD